MFKKIKKYINNPWKIFQNIKLKRLFKKRFQLNDVEYVTKYFRIKFGYNLNLECPVTFNEKLQWLKLNYNRPVFSKMVDKHEVKKLLKDIIDVKYIVPEILCCASFEDIPFDSLPDKFVLKTTHDSGCVYVCRDKRLIDYDKLKRKVNNSLKNNYFYFCREWPYKNITPKIIIEKFLENSNYDVLPVYKFFCFDGEPYLIQVIENDKTIDETVDYYDINWQKLKIKQNYPNSKTRKNKPMELDLMIELSKKLSKGLPFIRVDFYISNTGVYFSEFTFYSDAGFEPFYPKEWDFKLGRLIKLPIEMEE